MARAMCRVPTDWQLGCVEVKQRVEYLLKSGQYSDCTFLVGVESEQVVIAGHKLVLAMASPVFEAMFYGAMAESNDPIPILDIQPEAFRALLEYIYTDIINISSSDIVCDLYYAAKKYMLPHLEEECTRYLWSNPKPRNACRAYEFARLFEEKLHMDKCIQIISKNTKEVLTNSSFEDVELNTVITVFSLDHLNIDSELDLFEAVVRYAKAQDKRTAEKSVTPPSENGLPSDKRSKSPGSSTYTKDKEVNVEGSAQNSPEAVMATQKASDSSEQPLPAPSGEGNNKPDPKSDKPTIRCAIEKIRFLTLTPQQFAEGPAKSSLLTESEAFAVLMNIASSSSDVAMPSGFSTCRVPREQLIGDGPPCNDLYKKFRGILNTLTPQKFDTLLDRVKTLDINNQKHLEGVVDLVFEKAIDDPNLSQTYAALCHKLSVLKVPADNPTSPGKCVNFRALIINKCQNQFETLEVDEQKLKYESELAACTDPARKEELALMIVQKNRRVRRSVGNVKFVGELYKLKMLTSKVMNYCMKYLIEKDEDEKLECLCMLLTTIGEQVERELHPYQLDNIFEKMQDIVDRERDYNFSSRVRFMLQDVIELRERNWDKAVIDSQMMDQIQNGAEQRQRLNEEADSEDSCSENSYSED